MSMHTHQWAVTQYVLLSLPNVDHFSERLTSWGCSGCPAWCDITGEVRHGFALKTPDFWDRLAARQQGGGTSYGPAWSVARAAP